MKLNKHNAQWGTRGPNGDRAVRDFPLSSLSTDHLGNILKTQKQIPKEYTRIINEILTERQLAKIKIDKVVDSHRDCPFVLGDRVVSGMGEPRNLLVYEIVGINYEKNTIEFRGLEGREYDLKCFKLAKNPTDVVEKCAAPIESDCPFKLGDKVKIENPSYFETYTIEGIVHETKKLKFKNFGDAEYPWSWFKICVDNPQKIVKDTDMKHGDRFRHKNGGIFVLNEIFGNKWILEKKGENGGFYTNKIQDTPEDTFGGNFKEYFTKIGLIDLPAVKAGDKFREISTGYIVLLTEDAGVFKLIYLDGPSAGTKGNTYCSSTFKNLLNEHYEPMP